MGTHWRAWLLTGVDLDEAAKRTGMDTDVVAIYRDLFFDVGPWLLTDAGREDLGMAPDGGGRLTSPSPSLMAASGSGSSPSKPAQRFLARFLEYLKALPIIVPSDVSKVPTEELERMRDLLFVRIHVLSDAKLDTDAQRMRMESRIRTLTVPTPVSSGGSYSWGGRSVRSQHEVVLHGSDLVGRRPAAAVLRRARQGDPVAEIAADTRSPSIAWPSSWTSAKGSGRTDGVHARSGSGRGRGHGRPGGGGCRPVAPRPARRNWTVSRRNLPGNHFHLLRTVNNRFESAIPPRDSLRPNVISFT